jgi:FAD synthase
LRGRKGYGWILAEANFDSAEMLVAQMKRDEALAREILQARSAS